MPMPARTERGRPIDGRSMSATTTGRDAVHLRVTQEVARQVYAATSTENELQIIGIPHQDGRVTVAMDRGTLIFVTLNPFVTDFRSRRSRLRLFRRAVRHRRLALRRRSERFSRGQVQGPTRMIRSIRLQPRAARIAEVSEDLSAEKAAGLLIDQGSAALSNPGMHVGPAQWMRRLPRHIENVRHFTSPTGSKASAGCAPRPPRNRLS